MNEGGAREAPPYPQVLIRRVIAIAQPSCDARILAVGCGPATFTGDLARSGAAMVCLDRIARALRGKGCLILLWTRELGPSADVHRDLCGLDRPHAPGPDRREDCETQAKVPRGLGRMVSACGLFEELESGSVVCEDTDPVEDDLLPLSTCSHELRLEPAERQALFDGLRARIERDHGGRLRLSFASAFPVARTR